MGKVKAFDKNGIEIKKEDLVKIVKSSNNKHHWLRKGNKLRVAYFENRLIAGLNCTLVFLKSKKHGKLCRYGIQEDRVEVVRG